MKVAVDNFAKLAAENKIICLGGMKELGEATFNEHQSLIDQLKQFTWTKVVLVGNEFKDCTHPYHFFESVVAAKKWLNEQNFVQHTILIKGSRGIQMEQLITD
jgi:UDP-N-acetylmuramoyl-tripeptide--D-alanyl-D-alanine ligase